MKNKKDSKEQEAGSGVEESSPPETMGLREELDKARAREDELLRAVAELTNVNRRRKQDMDSIALFSQESLVRNLLPVLDDLERDERRAVELRLNEIRAYEGFTCQIELCFDHAQRTYVFDIRTEWFDELNDLIERMDDFFEDDEDENPLSGYYSNN